MTSESYKIPSSGGFCSTVDRDPTPSTSDPARVLDLVLRRSLMKIGAGAGLIFISPLGVRMRYAIRFHFPASNNAAEYEALVNGLHIA